MTLREIFWHIRQTQDSRQQQEVLLNIIMDLTVKQLQILSEILTDDRPVDAVVFLIIANQEQISGQDNKLPN